MKVLCCNALVDIFVREQKVIDFVLSCCKGKSVQIITNAKREDNVSSFMRVKEIFKANSINARLVNVLKDKIFEDEILYLGGGSPRKLMEDIKTANCEKQIVNCYAKTKLIIGQSAGGMVLFKNFIDEDENKNFKTFKGLNLIEEDVCFIPHYNNLDISEYGKNCLKYIEEKKINVLKLCDGEYITKR